MPPILLIKTCWGGKSLHYNFRPPSAGPYELSEKEKAGDKVEEITKNVGLNYRMMNEEVQAVLEDIGTHHPEYEASVGYEIAGFVWFQGFNDQFSDPFRDNYRQNMIHFIKDVRKEYQVPRMPFVIGVMGTGITAEKVGANAVSVAQREADYFEAVSGGVFCELGRGGVNFPAVVQALESMEYRGWIVVEQDVLPGMGSPLQSAVRNRGYLARLGL